MAESSTYANGKMTAGIPSLVPDKRHRWDVTTRTRAVDSQNLRDQAARDSFTTSTDGGHPVTSIEAQLGRPMSSKQLIDKLKKLNPRLHFEVANGDRTKMGIYRLSPEGKQFICGMERGFMPEFSVRHAEMITMPDSDLRGGNQQVERITRETRGWRTVLARLIRQGIISLSAAERCFEFGRDSKNWKELTT